MFLYLTRMSITSYLVQLLIAGLKAAVIRKHFIRFDEMFVQNSSHNVFKKHSFLNLNKIGFKYIFYCLNKKKIFKISMGIFCKRTSQGNTNSWNRFVTV
jgi:hypothetical protein